MTQAISAVAQAAREAHRDDHGRFGTQPASESGVDLSVPIPPSARELTEFQVRYGTASYTPHDPDVPEVVDRLRELDGPVPTQDDWGHELSRGGFYRGQGRGLGPMVTDPDGETRDDGTPVFRRYGSPSSAAVKASTRQLTDWKMRTMATAYQDPDFSAWAQDHMSRTDDDGDPDWSERAVMSRIVGEAMVVAGSDSAADRGTVLHWVSEKVDTGQDYDHGLDIAAEVGLEAEQVDRFADAYRDFNDEHGLRSVLVECTVVSDTHRKAGTADRLTELTKPLQFTDRDGAARTLPAGTRVIADVKTGKVRSRLAGRGEDRREVPTYRGGYAAQFATYAEGVPYDTVTGARSDWPDGVAPSQDWALLVQCDSDSVRSGEPRFHLEVVDLAAGREYLDASDQLRRAERAADDSAVYADRD